MALRTTPTIAICLTAGIAAGIALARPADPSPAAVAPPVAQVGAPPAVVDPTAPGAIDPYTGQPVPTVAADQAESNQQPPATPAAPAAQPAAIDIRDFAFSAPATVGRGSVITVTNLDGATHTLTADDGSFDSGALGQNQAVGLTAPSSPGMFTFFCAIHPSMQGVLVVG